MIIRTALGLTTLLGLASPAFAGDCRLALVLGLDVSSSVDAAEDQLQREGLAQALLAPEVARAFLTGDPVALYVFQWSGPSTQASILPGGWVMVESPEDLIRISSVVASSERLPYADYTAVGTALIYAADALMEAPICRNKTVDVSGDGENSSGIEPRAVYETFPYGGVTVNALVIGGPNEEGLALRDRRVSDRRLLAWFTHEVLYGPGAFSILADGYEDYERAMEAKLLRELELPLMSGLPIAEGGA